jgi:hypothetical protein
LRVKIEYKDKNLDIVNIEQYHLSDYCHLLSQRALSVLYQVEEVLEGKLDFRSLRHFLFDLAGDISRLPDNILDENQSENIKMKPPGKSFFSFLKRGE